MGQINWRPWASLATYNSNLYGDLAMWPFLFGNFQNFCRELRNVIDYAGAESIVFGSDAPVFEMVMPIKKMIGQIADLPNSAPNGIKFTKEEISAILGDNAAEIFGLN
jgi:predicted TIM-barrel fold metal-dependent hydrolase